MSLTSTAAFGAGGSEPYAHALRGGVGELLFLRNASSSASTTMDVSRWSADADAADLSLLASVDGPVLDIGCGPGRMVRAARDLGLVALGIDISRDAVRHARRLGGSFAEVSIFGEVPHEGLWQTALLVDGNIGIGGDISQLLERSAGLLRESGEILIELDARHDHVYLQVFGAGGRMCPGFTFAGQMVKTSLAAILSQHRIGVAPGAHIDYRVSLTLAPSPAVPVVLHDVGDAPATVRAGGRFRERVQLPDAA